jgi:hypothetical protein
MESDGRVRPATTPPTDIIHGGPSHALWRDRKGFNQQLDYLPLNNAQIVIRSVDDDRAGRGVSEVTRCRRASG